jgi:catechol 2,3-dioxygenase-like lactoylglutathione lyase family enzyme
MSRWCPQTQQSGIALKPARDKLRFATYLWEDIVLGYITLGTNDIEASKTFYSGLLPVIGGNGNMAAIVVDERAKVDALHAKALALGGSCEGPPGLRGEEGPMAFYAAYFRDPDGNKLCAYRMGPA